MTDTLRKIAAMPFWAVAFVLTFVLGTVAGFFAAIAERISGDC